MFSPATTESKVAHACVQIVARYNKTKLNNYKKNNERTPNKILDSGNLL